MYAMATTNVLGQLAKKSLKIQVSGNELSLKPGEWSDWVRFGFSYNPVVKINGIGRFRLLSIDPEVRLYLSPIQFDPENLPPGFDITTPAEYAHDLAHDNGGVIRRRVAAGWLDAPAAAGRAGRRGPHRGARRGRSRRRRAAAKTRICHRPSPE